MVRQAHHERTINISFSASRYHYSPLTMSFAQLGLTDELLKAVADQGYTTPTPVQQKAIPLILDGKDVLAGAQTGTGKTAGFTLPLLQRLAENHDPHQKPRRVRALILVPTRELAAQVYESVKIYGAHMPFHAEAVVGGAAPPSAIRKGTAAKNSVESNTKISAVGTVACGPSAASVRPGPM